MMNFPLRKLFYGVFLSACLSACVDNSSAPQQQNSSVDNFDFLGMMANYADNIIVPNYQALSGSAEKLAADDGVLATYCAALDDSVTEVSEELADAWGELQAAIQRSEMHTLGPVLENSGALLNRINSYNGSELSLCGIDQAVVLASQDDNFDIAARTNNQRGVTALEYLLFDNRLTHHCPSQIPETVGWNERSALERRQLRCAYAQSIAADIDNTARELLQAWAIDGENYRLRFINPNNIEDNLSALSDALFFLDVDVKDRKLGIPTGINDDGCSEFACSDAVESPYAEASLSHIRHNLESFAAMLTGGEGLGFDDIIRFAGVDQLNNRMLSTVDEAILLIDTADASLKQQVAAIATAADEAACANALANPSSPSEQSACQLYGLIKRLTDDLKVDFVAAVNVDLPERGQADND